MKPAADLWRSILALFIAAGPCCAAYAGQPACISAQEYTWTKSRYDKYALRYNTATIAQEYMKLDKETRSTRAQLRSCRENGRTIDQDSCEALAKQLDAAHRRQKAVTDRFETALSMQSYLAALEVKLREPRCKD
jgi:hypothetical protein